MTAGVAIAIRMITSLQNPKVKVLRQLHHGKGRRQQQQFLLEGTHLVQEAIATGWPLDCVWCTEAWAAAHPDLAAAVEITLASEAVIIAIATTQTPDGVVAVAACPEAQPPALPRQLGVLLLNLQDPGNVGTLIRSAVAFGADGVWLSGDSVDPYHPKLVRATAGQWLRQPPQVVPDMAMWLGQCRAAGIQIVATGMASTATPVWDVDWRRPTLIVLGNEGAGVSGEWEQWLQVPMQTEVESLNVAIAGSVVLYEAWRQRSAALPNR